MLLGFGHSGRSGDLTDSKVNKDLSVSSSSSDSMAEIRSKSKGSLAFPMRDSISSQSQKQRNHIQSHTSQSKCHGMEGQKSNLPETPAFAIAENYHKKEPEMTSKSSSSIELNNRDDLLCDDILSCISALDEVIAEFDDCSSLPYPLEIDTSFSSIQSQELGSLSQSVDSSTAAAASPSAGLFNEQHSNSTTSLQVSNSPSPNQSVIQTMLNPSNSSSRHVHSHTSFIPSAISTNGGGGGHRTHQPHQSFYQQVSNSSKSQEMPKGKADNSHQSHQIHKTSQLIHVSGSSRCSTSTSSSSSPSSSAGPRMGIKAPRKSIPVASSNAKSDAGGKHPTEKDTYSDTDVRFNSTTPNNSTAAKSGSDTYSKGTSYNILLANGKKSNLSQVNSKSIIYHNPFVSSSRNNSNNINNNNSNSNGEGGGDRTAVYGHKNGATNNMSTKILVSGFGCGLANGPSNNNSHNGDTNTFQETEQRAGGGVAFTITSGSGPKVKARSLGTTAPCDNNKSVKSSIIRDIPTVGHKGQELETDDSCFTAMKEHWNFPSEKNLPRSLRKTRKTCMLDEEEDIGPMNPGYGQQPWNRNYPMHPETDDGSASPVSKRSCAVANNNVNSNANCRMMNGRDDRRKIYEEVVVNQPSQPKSCGNGKSLSVANNAKNFGYNAPLVLHIEDQCRNERKQSTPPKQISTRDHVSITANNHNSNNEEVLRGGKSGPADQVTVVGHFTENLTRKPNLPNFEVAKSSNGSGDEAAGIRRARNGSRTSGTTGSCGSGRSSGRSSVNSDNNNSVTTGTAAVNCCGVVTAASNKLTVNTVTDDSNNKSGLSMNGSGSSSSSGIGITRGRPQLINGNGLVASSASSSSSGGSGSCAVLDVDDGYLSMINRNETQILWPDEMIENETFTADELKRISVCVVEEEEIFEKNSDNPKSHQTSHGLMRSDEKTDYFSDDSLELEPDMFLEGGEPMVCPTNKGVFSTCSPTKGRSPAMGMVYSAMGYHSGERRVSSVGGGGGVGSGGSGGYNASTSCTDSPGISPNNQQSNHNSAVHPQNTDEQQSHSQPHKKSRNNHHHHHYISRIPKISTNAKAKEESKCCSSVGADGGAVGGGGLSETSAAVSVSLRKPCSFFIPLTESAGGGGASAGEGTGTGGGIAAIPEVKQPPRLMRQLTHEIKIASPIHHRGEGQVEFCESAVDNAANNSSAPPPLLLLATTCSTKNESSRETRDTREASRQPNNATFLYSTSSPELSSSDIQPSTEIGDESVESSLFDSRISLTSIHDFVEEIMETALKSGLDEASINTNSLTNNHELPHGGPNDQYFSCADVEPLLVVDVGAGEPQVQQRHVLQGISVEEETANSQKGYLFTTTNTNTSSTSRSNMTVENKVAAELKHCEDYSDREVSCSEGCQVRLQQIDQATELEVDHDHQDKEQRKKQIETVARLQVAVTTFFTTNENFFGESKRFPAGTPTPADQSEETTDSHLSSTSRETNFSLESQDITDVPLMNSTRISLALDSMSSPTEVEPQNEAANGNGGGEGEEGDDEGATNGGASSSNSKISSDTPEPYSFIEDLNEQPPAFIPTPPPELLPLTTNLATSPSTTTALNGFPNNLTDMPNEEAADQVGITLTSHEDTFPLPKFMHGGCNNRNVWPGYDRHFGGEILNAKPGNGKNLSSRSQENLLDAVTKERLEKAFATRGQASTLPLNCRPPTSQRRASTFRNMFNKFRRNKNPEQQQQQTIPEVAELKDEEVQSITSRDSRKKPGFFSRLFRRSRKH